MSLRWWIHDLGALVPGAAAAGVACEAANNNLDVTRWGERTLLAWRTAPSHFASGKARLEATSCANLNGPWRAEFTVATGADVREPRWVAGPNGPQLWYVMLGSNPRRFQPQGVYRVRWQADGTWSAPEQMLDDPVVLWRIRHLGGQFVMFTYRGAEAMYSARPRDPVVEIRRSDDLDNWTAPTEFHQGGTEVDAAMLDGRVVAVSRNEGPTRRGGDVLVGDSLDSLAVCPVARKPDSPHVFAWRGAVWCFARRSLRAGGTYDRVPRATPAGLALRIDQLLWSASRKRSALYRVCVDRSGGHGAELRWELDLPSRGDCSFAAVLDATDDELVVVDYSTPADCRDGSWIRGQLGPTEIRAWALRPMSDT